MGVEDLMIPAEVAGANLPLLPSAPHAHSIADYFLFPLLSPESSHIHQKHTWGGMYPVSFHALS